MIRSGGSRGAVGQPAYGDGCMVLSIRLGTDCETAEQWLLPHRAVRRLWVCCRN